MVELVPIEKNMDITNITDEPLKTGLNMTLQFYKKAGYVKPWISYLIKYQNEYTGTCAFKGAPSVNKVEIAYWTFPAYEGKGIATAACSALVDIARNKDNTLTITARTLPETNASTTVLEKNSFILIGTVDDPDDGEVYEWQYKEQL